MDPRLEAMGERITNLEHQLVDQDWLLVELEQWLVDRDYLLAKRDQGLEQSKLYEQESWIQEE